MLHKDYVYSITFSPEFGYEVSKGGLFDEDEHWLDESDEALPREWVAIAEDVIETTEYSHHIGFELYVIEQGAECTLSISGTDFDGERMHYIHITEIKQSYPTFTMTAVIRAIADNQIESFLNRF